MWTTPELAQVTCMEPTQFGLDDTKFNVYYTSLHGKSCHQTSRRNLATYQL